MQFETIPVDLDDSGAYAEFKARGTRVPPQSRKSLIIAPMDTTNGEGSANTIYQITDDDEADRLFYRKSVAAVMARAFRSMPSAKYAQLYVVGLANGTTAATKTITITVSGTTSKASTLPFYIDGRRVLVAIPSGSDQSAVAAAIEAAFDADTANHLVTASVTTNVVTLTADWQGEASQDFDIRLGYHDGDVWDADIGVAIANGTAGAGNAALTTAITNLGATKFDIIACPFTDATSLTAIENAMDARWVGTASNDGHIYAAARGDASALDTLGNSRNSKHLTLLSTDLSPTPPWIFAAQLAAARATTPDTSMQLKGKRLVDCLAPPRGLEFLPEERDGLLKDGISTYNVNDARQVHVKDVITTYKQNANGFADRSYFKEAYLTNLSTMRYELIGTLLLAYPNHKYGKDGDEYNPGQPIATENRVRQTILALYEKWVGEARARDYEAFAAALRVEANDANPNRMDIFVPSELIKYADIFASQIAHA